MEIIHKLRINCGMTLGDWMRGVIRLISENPAAVPVDLFLVDHCCWSHTLRANRHVLVCLCTVSFCRFFWNNLPVCDSGVYSRSSTFHSDWHCSLVWSQREHLCWLLEMCLFSSFCQRIWRIFVFGKWRPPCPRCCCPSPHCTRLQLSYCFCLRPLSV